MNATQLYILLMLYTDGTCHNMGAPYMQDALTVLQASGYVEVKLDVFSLTAKAMLFVRDLLKASSNIAAAISLGHTS